MLALWVLGILFVTFMLFLGFVFASWLLVILEMSVHDHYRRTGGHDHWLPFSG